MLLLSCHIWHRNCVSWWKGIKKRPSIFCLAFEIRTSPLSLSDTQPWAAQRWSVFLPFYVPAPLVSIPEWRTGLKTFVSVRCVWPAAGKKQFDIIEGGNWEVWTKFRSTKAMPPDWSCDGRCSWDLCGSLQNSALHIGLSWIGLYPTYLQCINNAWFYPSVSNLAIVRSFIEKRDKRLCLQPLSP